MDKKESIYERLFGIEPLVNLCGAWTHTGGSRASPEVLHAFSEAAEHFVDLRELLDRAGKRVAELLGVEAAYITSGASAAVALMTAACMTGTDLQKIYQLPDTRGMKSEVVVQRGHSPYSFMVRYTGARIVWAGGNRLLTVYPRTLGTLPEDIEASITDDTCAIYTVASDNCPPVGLVPLEEVSKIAHKYSIPVFTDAADMLPPVSNLKEILRKGSDLVSFSGWKSLQCFSNTGCIVGKKDLVEACSLNAVPFHAIGRPYKVNKEAIVAFVVALQEYTDRDWDKFHQKERERSESIAAKVRNLSSVADVQLVYPDEAGVERYRLLITIDERSAGLTAKDVVDQLLSGSPPIAINTNYVSSGKLCIETWMYSDKEYWGDIFAKRLGEILR